MFLQFFAWLDIVSTIVNVLLGDLGQQQDCTSVCIWFKKHSNKDTAYYYMHTAQHYSYDTNFKYGMGKCLNY